MNPEIPENKIFENKEKEEFKELQEIFGDNFNPEKSIHLGKDVDRNNKERELGSYEAFWTEIKNPETNEVVEAKVYIPKNGKVDKIFLVSPGYRGDFVLQEMDYADNFAKDGRAIIMMRHNGLRIEGEDMKNYVHCPDKTEGSQKSGQSFLGSGENFSFKQANQETKTALMALSDKIDMIKKIDVLGHSWGARISLLSIQELMKNNKTNENSNKILSKLNNLIMIGAWLETNEDKIKPALGFFENEAKGNFFKGMNPQEVIDSAIVSSKKIKEIKAQDLPKNMRVVGVQSVGDHDVDLKAEYMQFFKQIKDKEKLGSVILKDLANLLPEKIGNRPSEQHDHAVNIVRKWIGEIIK